MDEANAKVKPRNIWNCSVVFWNVRPYMTGMQLLSKAGIITVRPIRMPHLCT
jgi:hypothetical protein